MVSGFLAGALGGASVSIVINAIDNFSKTFGKANASLAKLGAAITGIGVAGTFAIGGLIKLGGQFEQTQIAFTTMLGSADKANELLKELADFASRTPFTITGVEQNAKQLLAMSIEVDKLLPTLKSLGDVSAGLNVPLERIAVNFGQVKVQGKLTGRELRDFSIAGVPLIAELAKNLNIAESEVKEMVSAGKIGFPEVEAAFTSMTSEGGKFFDLMDAQSKTFLGQVSNIKDSFIKVARVMSDTFLPAAKFVAERLAIIVSWFEEHPTVAKFAAVTLGVGTALALIIGPLLILIASLPFLIAGFATLSAVSLPLTATILAIIVGIGLLIAGAVLLWKKWDTLGVKTQVLIGILFPMVSLPIAIIKNWDILKIRLAEIWNSIVKFSEKGTNKVIEFINKLIDATNKVRKVLGFDEISGVDKISRSGLLIDIEALKNKTKEQQKITEESTKQTTELEKQQELVKKLQGFKVLSVRDPKTGERKFGDIFKPGAFSRSEFGKGDIFGKEGAAAEQFAFQQARGGGGVTINIDNISGLDPEEVASALEELLKDKVSGF